MEGRFSATFTFFSDLPRPQTPQGEGEKQTGPSLLLPLSLPSLSFFLRPNMAWKTKGGVVVEGRVEGDEVRSSEHA